MPEATESRKGIGKAGIEGQNPAPQAGRPASADDFGPADGVFRDGETGLSSQGPCASSPPAVYLEEAMTVTLHVCITCRAGETPAEGETTPGKRLHGAILEAGVPDGVNVVPVECLSACSQGCSVALSAPGRWSYVYGRLSDANAQDVIAGAAAYAAAPDGLVPWRSRPEIFRKQSLARIPPMSLPEAAE